MGIVHQVNLEDLARVVVLDEASGGAVAIREHAVGTDSHTTMGDGLGVVGRGVGGSRRGGDARPAAVDVDPQVLGVRLGGWAAGKGRCDPFRADHHQRLRKHGVVGKFVEFYGDGLAHFNDRLLRDAR